VCAGQFIGKYFPYMIFVAMFIDFDRGLFPFGFLNVNLFLFLKGRV